MGKTGIYYFTGTGNSLFAAKELQKRLPDSTLIPILSLLDQESFTPKEETVGFVFPIYQTALPVPVRRFLDRIRLENARYVFAVATRIGTSHGAFHEIDKTLKRQGRCLDLGYSVNMASNDPKFNYVVPTQETIAQLERTALQDLGSVSEKIADHSAYRGRDENCKTRIPFVNLLTGLVKLTEKSSVNLYHDEGCTGCGICEKVCTSGRIRMVENRPLWQADVMCFRCNACINYCPVQSVQLKGFTEKNGRYSHPYATAEDIAEQKGSCCHTGCMV